MSKNLQVTPPTAEAAECVGIGFIHSFDFERCQVVLYTPIHGDQLSRVNALLRGDIVWEPHSSRGQRATVGAAVAEGDVQTHIVSPLQPYCCAWALEGLAAGTRVISTRGNLKRRRLLQAKSKSAS